LRPSGLRPSGLRGDRVRLASASRNDRVAYTEGKTEFIVRMTEEAKSG